MTYPSSLYCALIYRASLVAQRLKRLPAMRETWVRSLGWEDPLEKEMATYSSILAWRIPWAEEPGKLQSVRLQKSRTRLNHHVYEHAKSLQWCPILRPHGL